MLFRNSERSDTLLGEFDARHTIKTILTPTFWLIQMAFQRKGALRARGVWFIRVVRPGQWSTTSAGWKPARGKAPPRPPWWPPWLQSRPLQWPRPWTKVWRPPTWAGQAAGLASGCEWGQGWSPYGVQLSISLAPKIQSEERTTLDVTLDQLKQSFLVWPPLDQSQSLFLFIPHSQAGSTILLDNHRSFALRRAQIHCWVTFSLVSWVIYGSWAYEPLTYG